ncbi:MAG: hypothetical protein ACREDO_06000 [Methyloceanibacter sp.]
MQKLACDVALLFAAAEVHEDWEVLVDEKGEPTGVRRKASDGWPNTPNELAEWFVETFPERAARILTSDIKTVP